ncbi:fatty-acyl-CoA synthase [Burkholderiales bacterium]|nr:MAG: long-chain fatty acid--CoA ligase [Burkholderiales bacterium]CAG1004630.1 fatty-acyl-CoA synthase [Burkholderiales bacterium]
MNHSKARDLGIFGGLSGAGDLMRRNATVAPQHPGLIFGATRLTWRETNARCNRFAHALRALGVKRGDRVGIFARNSHQWVEAAFALAKLGAVLVTVNHRLSAPEVRFILEDSGASALFASAEELEVARGAAAGLPGLQLLVSLGGAGGELPEYEALLAGQPEGEPALDSPLAYDDPLMLLYTSGTTGFPKGAIYTHGGTLVGMLIHVHAIASRSTHRVMLPSPLYSAAGIAGIYCSVYVGSSTFIINFDPVTALETIQRERITFTNLVPTTIQRLMAREDFGRYDLSSLEVLLYGGSPMPVPVLRELRQRLPHCGYRQTFASTETGCAGTVLEPAEHLLALDDPAQEGLLLSCGRPQTNVEVRVTDAAGRTLPDGETGEIAVLTEANVAGFWNRPEATNEALRDGWIYTGDMGYRDENGYFYLVDRKRDLIVSGAFNVYPSEVERVLQQHPAVYEVAVIGVPSKEWGEEVKAIVVLRPDQVANAGEIIAFCEGRIAGFKKPKSVDFVAALPRNPTGKILRRELREPFWQGETRKIG